MPGESGGPVATTLVCYLHTLHARLRVQRASGISCALCFSRDNILAQFGRIGRPAFPAPSEFRERDVPGKTRAQARRDREAVSVEDRCLKIECAVIRCARTRQILRPSSPAKAGDPVFRSFSDRTGKPRRTGYPAFAGYDDLLWSSAVRCFTPGMTQDDFPAFATAFSIRRASTAQ